MHFTTFLKKHFDIEKIVGTSDSGNDTESIYVYEKGNDTESIYVYEKGNDCEPLFILRESWINAEIKKCGIWTVGNIYSTLEHGKEYTESELREMIKKGKVTSKY
ncbi:cobalamin biosynthesis protein CbiX [Escherichia coli]|nr:cobalamin biosynthesis protein CbiX [Escherichia coli]EGI4664985.1 cobalamin biosynthesis protein CbiX [Escherichia coli]